MAESRKEIHKRFDYLDWKDQEWIMTVFLESGKADRQWVYSKMLHLWDSSFEPKIKELWERLHEYRCAWVIIRHFPTDYIVQNIDQFTGNRDYFFICLRLAEDKDYVIDKGRLSQTDYLALLYHTGRSITEEEACDILYEIVHKICISDFFQMGYACLKESFDSDIESASSTTVFYEVDFALRYLLKMNQIRAAYQFYAWNDKVEQTVLGSDEFKAFSANKIDDYYNWLAKLTIVSKYAYQALDDKYKKSSDPDMDRMMESEKWRKIWREIMYDKIIEMKSQASQTWTPEPADPAVLKKMTERNPVLNRLLDAFALDANDSAVPF